MIEKTDEELVKDFFFEHPIHDFTSKQIAEYLKMNQDVLEEILEKMFLNNDLVETTKYRASSIFIKKVISKINKQNDKEIKKQYGCE